MLDTFQEHVPKLQQELWIWEADGLQLRLHFVLALLSIPSFPVPYTTNFSCISKFSVYSAHSLHFNHHNWTHLWLAGYPVAIPSFSTPVVWCAFPFFLLSSLQIPLLDLWVGLTWMCLWRLEFLPLLCPFLLRGERVKAWISWNCCGLIDKRAPKLILLVLGDIINILIYH